MKKRDKYINDEIIHACRTCQIGKEIALTGEYLCKVNGVVSADYLCKKYTVNTFLKRPPKKRMIDTSIYSESDFRL